MLNKIKKYENKLNRWAKALSGNDDVSLAVSSSGGSYAQYDSKSKKINIHIDASMAYEDSDTLASLLLKVQGIVAHEAGHVAFTDFDVIRENSEKELGYQNIIPEIAKEIKADLKNIKEHEKLKEAIYGYIYYHNLADMLNSIEDAAIEYWITRRDKSSYGNVVAMRNFIHKKEVAFLQHLSTSSTGDAESISTYITEIRHYAVIGYREDIKPLFLPNILSKKDIEDIATLGFYARVGSKGTKERNAISKVLLDKLKPLIDEKTDKFYNDYMSALMMGDDDLLNKLGAQMVGMSGPSELSIEKCSPNMPTSSAMTPPGEYNLKLPEELQQEVERKMGEDEGQNSDNSSSSNGNGEQSESNAGESGMDEQNGNSESSEGQENDSNGENEGNATQNSSENAQGGDDNDTDSKEDGSGVENAKDVLDKNKKEAALEANNEYEKSFQKESKTLEKNLNKGIDNEIKCCQRKGKAPTLGENLSSPESITECHKGIRVNYFPSKQIAACQNSPGDVIEQSCKADIKLISNKFAKKLKEILMFQAKNRRLNGLKSGQMNDAALSRIITDKKVFRKKINGIEKKGRIEVLIDLSGSMSGDKMINAISASYMLVNACKKVKVPISVMGHMMPDRDRIQLFHYVEYENYLKNNSEDNLLKAVCGGSNQDGLAIFHAATDLVRHKKKDESAVLIVISDGAPAGRGNYYGEYAENDIKNIIRTFEKRYDVQTIGVGIGRDTQHVGRIYENNILVPDVSELSTELLKILKNVVLK